MNRNFTPLYLVPFLAVLLVPQPAWSEGCNGNLSGIANLGCERALEEQHEDKIDPLFDSGLLDREKHAIRGTCQCAAADGVLYCGAQYEVHRCFRDNTGNYWISPHGVISGEISQAVGKTAVGNASRQIPSVQSDVAERAAQGLVDEVKERRR